MVSPHRLALEDRKRAEFRRTRARQRTLPVQTSPRRAHDLIRASIRLGLDGGQPFKAEHELVRRMATSRNALREALQMLAAQGLLSRRAGQGTRVSAAIAPVSLDEAVPRGPGVMIHQLESHFVPATPVMRHQLRTDDEWILMSEQLVEVNGEPLMLRVGYCPQSRVRDGLVRLIRTRAYPGAPVAEMFPRLFGVKLGTIENTIEAVPCEERSAGLLGIAVGAPVLVREMLLRGVDGVPYLLIYAHHRGDRVALSDALPRTRPTAHAGS